MRLVVTPPFRLCDFPHDNERPGLARSGGVGGQPHSRIRDDFPLRTVQPPLAAGIFFVFLFLKRSTRISALAQAGSSSGGAGPAGRLADL